MGFRTTPIYKNKYIYSKKVIYIYIYWKKKTSIRCLSLFKNALSLVKLGQPQLVRSTSIQTKNITWSWPRIQNMHKHTMFMPNGQKLGVQYLKGMSMDSRQNRMTNKGFHGFWRGLAWPHLDYQKLQRPVRILSHDLRNPECAWYTSYTSRSFW